MRYNYGRIYIVDFRLPASLFLVTRYFGILKRLLRTRPADWNKIAIYIHSLTHPASFSPISSLTPCLTTHPPPPPLSPSPSSHSLFSLHSFPSILLPHLLHLFSSRLPPHLHHAPLLPCLRPTSRIPSNLSILVHQIRGISQRTILKNRSFLGM